MSRNNGWRQLFKAAYFDRSMSERAEMFEEEYAEHYSHNQAKHGPR
jgi:hypothetical protein